MEGANRPEETHVIPAVLALLGGLLLAFVTGLALLILGTGLGPAASVNAGLGATLSCATAATAVLAWTLFALAALLSGLTWLAWPPPRDPMPLLAAAGCPAVAQVTPWWRRG